MKKIISLISMLSLLASCSNPMSGMDGELSVDDVQVNNDPNTCVKIYVTNMANEVQFQHTEGPDQVLDSKKGILESGSLAYKLINRSNFATVQTGTVFTASYDVQYGQTTSLSLYYNTDAIKNVDPYFEGLLILKTKQTFPTSQESDANGTRTQFNQVNCGKIIFATLKNTGLKKGDVYDGHNPYVNDVVLTEAIIEGSSASERSLNVARYANVIDKEILGHTARSISLEMDPVTLSRSMVSNNYEQTVKQTLNNILLRAQSRGNKDANLPANLRQALSKHILNSIDAAKLNNK